MWTMNEFKCVREATSLKTIAIGLFIAFMLQVAVADELAVPGPMRAAGVLRVGTTGDYKPFSYRNASGEYIGLDIDMAASLAQSLGVRLEIVPTSWPTLMQDLAAQRFDIAMGGVSVTHERQAVASFSQPYLRDSKTAIARCENLARFDTLEAIDRPDIRVIVNPGGTNERFIRTRLHRAMVMVYPDNVTIFDQLVAGKADVMITDATEARLQQRLHPQLCVAHPDAPFESVDKAYLLPRDSVLKPLVDAWLAQQIARGDLQAKLDHWLAYDWNASMHADRVVALLVLMRERLAISKDVARSKWNSGAAIEDAAREREIIAALSHQAGVAGLPVPWAAQFFRAQIEASKIEQRTLHERWHRQGRGKFDAVPDLATDVRPRLDALTPRLLAAIGAAWPTLCDPALRAAALQSVQSPSEADDIAPAAFGTAISALRQVPACTR